ncbi:hypothetical protein [Pseudoalteromonas piscicida]|uniref:Uncharacterized protein n=1 Tax=Pseudoalteromonas piscicida TaxID=43662 RepID=A0A2A5JJN0_PSEO7|nr:hypothetical protein [Pseudoalteromonas piscicida]PCK29636.1 hypothetical protein CEX98_21805 [Pseudoalteromonas piscicida]
MFRTLLLLIAVMLTGCTTTPTVNLSDTLPDSTYTGRGTDAGPMLVAAMGSTGLAVGLAIDQGIAKEFDEQIQHSKAEYLPKIGRLFHRNYATATNVEFKSITFSAVKGNDDLVNAEVKFKIDSKNSNSSFTVRLENMDFDELKATDTFWKALETELWQSN